LIQGVQKMPEQNFSASGARRMLLRYFFLFIPLLFGTRAIHADPAAFDLAGPHVEVRVTRGGKTLPISQVPNLQAGDRLWIQADFSETQSVHYLLIAAFLRGTTNPPPDEWFTRIETWNKQTRTEGSVITVPQGAQQCLLFLAPETGGDFDTLRSAVRGKPGAFVRASQDLNQASLDRSRVDKYLSEVKETSDADPDALHKRSVLLARTLNLKLNEDCFDRPLEEQAPCLTKDSDSLVLDDGQSQSMVATLASGPSADLMGAVSTTSLAGGGFYSPYVGSIVDLAKIFGNMRSAKYQYIPALAVPKGDELNLQLNTPPSFKNPKSVLVVSLPAVEGAQQPPLRNMNAAQIFCLQKIPLVLPVEGSPLVFSTDMGHNFVLHVESKSGASIDLRATPDAVSGGFSIDNTHLPPTNKFGTQLTATIRGSWGFDTYAGPSFHFQVAHPVSWTIPTGDHGALIVGREDSIHLESECAVCVDQISARDQQGKDLKASWRLLKPGELEVQIPLKDTPAGPVKIVVTQFGLSSPDQLPLRAYSEAAHLDNFIISAGDKQGVLRGNGLNEVDSMELSGIRFVPAKLSRGDQKDELSLAASNQTPTPSLQPGEKVVANVALKDGRVLDLQTTVAPPRPQVKLISKSVQMAPSSSAIRFGDPSQLPQNGKLSFFLQSEVPDEFSHTEKIEVATEDGSSDVILSIADGDLVLQDSHTLLAVLDPVKSFGPSAFGALRFRPVSDTSGDSSKGDWQPLATLVRVPVLKEIRCPDDPDQACHLIGTNLFLIDSVASDQKFGQPIVVPVGFVESSLNVPRPSGTLLYIRLRDDPSVINTVALPVLPQE
jgi:hypothetical protein